MDNEFQSRVEHFAALKSKYQATKYEDSLPSSLLYLILRKVDLGIQLTELEFNWLLESENFETLEVIQQSEQRRAEELRKLEAEFSQLQSKYRASCCHTSLPLFHHSRQGKIRTSSLKAKQDNGYTP